MGGDKGGPGGAAGDPLESIASHEGPCFCTMRASSAKIPLCPAPLQLANRSVNWACWPSWCRSRGPHGIHVDCLDEEVGAPGP